MVLLCLPMLWKFDYDEIWRFERYIQIILLVIIPYNLYMLLLVHPSYCSNMKAPIIFCMECITREHAKVDRIACLPLADKEFCWQVYRVSFRSSSQSNTNNQGTKCHPIWCSKCRARASWWWVFIWCHHKEIPSRQEGTNISTASRYSAWCRYTKQSVNAAIRRLGCYSNRL